MTFFSFQYFDGGVFQIDTMFFNKLLLESLEVVLRLPLYVFAELEKPEVFARKI